MEGRARSQDLFMSGGKDEKAGSPVARHQHGPWPSPLRSVFMMGPTSRWRREAGRTTQPPMRKTKL